MPVSRVGSGKLEISGGLTNVSMSPGSDEAAVGQHLYRQGGQLKVGQLRLYAFYQVGRNGRMQFPVRGSRFQIRLSELSFPQNIFQGGSLCNDSIRGGQGPGNQWCQLKRRSS